MKKNIHAFVILVTALVLAFTTACGQMDTMATVAEDTMAASPEATGTPIGEVESMATYVEEHGLAFEDATKARTQGTICVGEDPGSLDIIDIDWEITNIAFADPEDGVQKITIEQESHGYLWKDGDTFKTNLNVPVGRLCDIYIGQMIPVNGESKTEVNWKGETYIIKATETVSWEDGDWGTGWAVSPSGEGEILPSTLKVRTDIEVTEGYNGLALILTPITDANGSVDGGKIMDVWTDDSCLFNVSELSVKFGDVAEGGETVASTEAGVEEKPVEQPTGTTSKPAESTPKPTAQPATHTHNYTSNVTVQPTCVNAGEKTFTCTGCGNSYTESIGMVAHNYVEATSVIHHDEQYEAVKREIPGYNVIICGCGEEFTDNDVWNNHCIANIEANGPFIACAGPYDIEQHPSTTTYDYVLVKAAWDETVTTYRCSVCGQQK